MNRRHFIKLVGAGSFLNFIPAHAVGVAGSDLRGYIRTNWSRDPYALGSYSFFAKGSNRSHVRALAKPLNDRVYFAGEACHPKYNSTVHAAYESGLIAAESIRKFGHERIAIVGAGASGLAAAQELSYLECEVTVFEGRDRVGGRIWTDDRLGVPLDLGASWIHGIKGNPLVDLADRLGLPMAKTGDDMVIRGEGGRLIEEEDIPDWLDEVIEIQHSLGAGSESINDRAYWIDRNYGGSDVVLPRGYEGILNSLKGSYETELNTEVVTIRYDDGGVVLTLKSGVERGFDAVLVTVPLGVLKSGKLEFNPPLPASKLKAIDRLGVGTLDKVYLLFEEIFWDRDATWIVTPENGLPQGEFNQWLNLYPIIAEPVVLAFNGAAPALKLAGLSDDEIVQRAVAALRSSY